MHPVPMGSRAAIRRAVDLRCELVCARFDVPVWHRATDLSLDGIWLETADPLRAGEEVVICFAPEGLARELMLFAEVARVTTSRRRVAEPGIGMGLAFVDLTGAERAQLSMWLAGRRSPVPRRRRPVGGVSVVPAPAAPQPAAPHRPLAVCWR